MASLPQRARRRPYAVSLPISRCMVPPPLRHSIPPHKSSRTPCERPCCLSTLPGRSLTSVARHSRYVVAAAEAPKKRNDGHRHPSSSNFSRAHRSFHTYFVTHLPSSSLHPESVVPRVPTHGLPRDASEPHTPGSGGPSPAVSPPNMPGRDLTVVRIPLRRAKHHFGAASARGSRPYNEDTDQAGIIDVPAFAKRAPQSVVRQKPGEAKAPEGALGDPQIFYFGIFDGHGGTQCSAYLRDGLHTYIEKASADFGLKSTLQRNRHTVVSRPLSSGTEDAEEPQDQAGAGDKPPRGESRAIQMERDLVSEYRSTIGGYYRRFNPPYFNLSDDKEPEICLESVLSYAFLRADLDFVRAQADRPDPDDPRVGDTPLNNDEILGSPSARAPVPGPSDMRFKGGSTASVALISTPTPTPFWHPDAHSTLVVAHVGDTRVLLCETATGQPHPLTSDHHPTTPTESRRLRRYAPAGSMVSGDSFGEERIAGLANSRAFGDIRSKRIGVSAEPELSRIDMRPAQYAFLVLTSDGVSATLTDQEIVDVVKEAPTPERAARAVVDYATEVSHDGDNATCQVIRLGGWARRSEGGLGSLGTKEIRDHRRAEALDPRRTKQ